MGIGSLPWNHQHWRREYPRADRPFPLPVRKRTEGNGSGGRPRNRSPLGGDIRCRLIEPFSSSGWLLKAYAAFWPLMPPAPRPPAAIDLSVGAPPNSWEG